MTDILTIDGKPIRCGDVVMNRYASVDNPTRVGVVIARGHRIGKLNPGPYITVADLEGRTWEIIGDKHRLEIIGFLDIEHAKGRGVRHLFGHSDSIEATRARDAACSRLGVAGYTRATLAAAFQISERHITQAMNRVARFLGECVH